ncbi:hypothetical protein [uncultured Desulfovibrio sp.]|uniref:hypothetical protein n=1 Tax=uncultured Desulfovibrio sp. TaxID=167968 RepID=UPI0028038E64|nr:hypothetical protein [uncultured Desulfovibrio sp.]
MNCARMLLALLCLALCLAGPAIAAETPEGRPPEGVARPGPGAPQTATPVIFGEWRFGMDREAALRLPGAREGSGDMAGHVLLPEITWAGLPWNVSLEFRQGGADANAGRLVRVCLLEAYSRERLDAVNALLREKGFEMLAMRAEGRDLDFIAILKAFGSDELQKRIAGLYQTDSMNFMSFGWFDTRGISREMKIMARNLTELLQIVRADTREAEVTLLGADGKASHILVIFSLPILETQTFGGEGSGVPPKGNVPGGAAGQPSPSEGGNHADH